MSERHAIPLLSNVETAPQPGELPITIEAFHVALQAEREKVLAELRPTLEREITEHVTAQIERTVAAQVEAHRQALEASFDQRVAAGVAQKVQEILEQWRLSRHRMFGPSSESHQGELFNEVEALADQAAGTEDEHEGEPAPVQDKARPKRGHRRALPPELNRTGDRGGFLVKVKQVPQSALQVADSIALRPQRAECRRWIRAGVGG